VRIATGLLAAGAAAALVAGCGDEDPPPPDPGAEFAADLESIMSDQVDPAGRAATDAYTNIAQGNPDVEGELGEVVGAGEDLDAAEEAVTALDPPEAAAVPTEELAARIGVLAGRLAVAKDAESFGWSADNALIAVENLRIDLDRIENRANQAIEAAEGSSS
jgi:hypothetical protein